MNRISKSIRIRVSKIVVNWKEIKVLTPYCFIISFMSSIEMRAQTSDETLFGKVYFPWANKINTEIMSLLLWKTYKRNFYETILRRWDLDSFLLSNNILVIESAINNNNNNNNNKGVFSWCNGSSAGLRNRSTRVRTPVALLR